MIQSLPYERQLLKEEQEGTQLMAESIWNIYIVHIKYEEIMSMASARRKYHLFSYHIYEPGLSSSPLLCVYHHKALSIHNFFCFYILKTSLLTILLQFI